MNAAQILFLENKNRVREYQKFGNVVAKQVTAGLKIDTVIDGEIETTNTSKDGDWLVTGPKGEQYLIADDKFKKRYAFVSKTPRGDKYKAVGNVFAVQFKGATFKFKAPWGEEMLCRNGDFICSTSMANVDDVYRIEKDAFAKTYKRKGV